MHHYIPIKMVYLYDLLDDLRFNAIFISLRPFDLQRYWNGVLY
jgi:hypothetical protein